MNSYLRHELFVITFTMFSILFFMRLHTKSFNISISYGSDVFFLFEDSTWKSTIKQELRF